MIQPLLSVPILYRFFRRSFGPKRACALVLHRILRKILDDRYLHVAGITWQCNDRESAPDVPFLKSPLSEEEVEWFRHNSDRVQDYRKAGDQICSHAFETPVTGLIQWGWPPRWHQDLKSGYQWPIDPYPVYRGLPPPAPGVEIQIPWALSRGYHLVALAQAWLLTGEEHYAAECFRHWESWVEANPPGEGIHWVSTLEVAIRTLHWLWAFALLEKAPGWTLERLSLLFNALQLHGRHIEHNLEIGVRKNAIVAGNHYLGGVSALCCLGMFCPQIPDASHWVASGWKALQQEISRQVLTDGVHFETSTGYHCLALEMFMLPALTAMRQNLELPDGYRQRVCQMLEVLPFLSRPDRSMVKLGDDDNGRFLAMSGISPCQNRPEKLLALGRFLTDRDDLPLLSEDWSEEPFWLLGRRGMEDFTTERPPGQLECGIRHFRESGWFIMQNERLYLAFRSGPPVPEATAHSHSDLFSIELWLEGVPVIHDPGTGSYTGDPVLRNLLRSTRSHNAVLVDGCEIIPFDPGELFALEANGIGTRVRDEKISADSFRIEMEHDAYQRLKDPVSHQRSIACRAKEPVLMVRDRLWGEQDHRAVWCWNLHPDREVLVIERTPTRVRLELDGVLLETSVLGGEFAATEIVPALASPRYGQYVDAKRLEVRLQWRGEIAVATRFEPTPG